MTQNQEGEIVKLKNGRAERNLEFLKLILIQIRIVLRMKWLKDRKGLELDFHEIIHYSNIIYVIAHTLLTTKEIDEVYKQG